MHKTTCHCDGVAHIEELKTLLSIDPAANDVADDDCSVRIKDAIQGVFKMFIFTPFILCITVEQIFNVAKSKLRLVLKYCLKYSIDVKSYLTININFIKLDMQTNEVKQRLPQCFSTKSKPCQSDECMEEFIDEACKEFARKVETFLENGSGWLVESIDELILRLVSYHVIRGGAGG